MTCKEAVFSENALDYIIGNYRGEEYVKGVYNPDCYMAYDNIQGVIYQEIQQINSANIERYGFSAIPNVYGLMSEEALEESGVLRIRRQPYLDLYGQGILIGFVDTGIDFTHEAFVREDNTTKIVSLWDQTVVEGDGSEQFPYGRIYSRAEINQALKEEDPHSAILSQDEIGHGTFLAGVAAGRGNRIEEFSGVAPSAELVIVKCKQAKKSYRSYYGIPESVPAYQENDIMAGVAHILRVANEERKPVVICIGMGTNMGSHDGESNLSAFMDRYTTVQGVAMISSAGNEGNARHHHYITRREETINIDVEGNLDGFMAQLWWQTPGSLTLDVISPSGDALNGIRAVSNTRRRKVFNPENTTLEIYFGFAQERTRSQVVVLRFIAPKTGIWKVRVSFTNENPGAHIWLPIRQFLSSEVFFLAPEPDVTICNPGDGNNLITVSAYDAGEGSLYLQASRGFTVSGNVKPEVVAPGVNVTGPYPRGRYGTMTGTSVAAALSAGIAALFMERYNYYGISGLSVKELFIRGAVPRGMPYPNTEWGYGTVNAYDSITRD
ncbi:MAG: S8 family peptidase [Lachnospiraceae bacterium]|nr:S8 family peptidase [Lachnospiraceae bacterium]